MRMVGDFKRETDIERSDLLSKSKTGREAGDTKEIYYLRCQNGDNKKVGIKVS